MSKFIVGIGFTTRAGKTTAAEGLARELGFRTIGFADQLKELAVKANPLITTASAMVNKANNNKLGWLLSGLGGWEQVKDTYPEARVFLENLGKGGRDVFGDDFWVEQVLRKVDASDHDRWVIADVRYRNEADAIRARGGVVIRLDRPGFSPRDFERDMEGYDFDEVFDNDKGIVDLQADVVAWVKNRLEYVPTSASTAAQVDGLIQALAQEELP